MITCKLGDKEYYVDFIPGRALREIGPAMEAYRKLARVSEVATKGTEISEEDAKTSVEEVCDEMVRWFCLAFGKQFTPDEVYDNYPADRLVSDIALAILATQAQMTGVLDSFPTKAAQAKKKEES